MAGRRHSSPLPQKREASLPPDKIMHRVRRAASSCGSVTALMSASSSRLPNGLDGGLQRAQAFACCLLGILVALPLIIDFQAGPFIRIHGPDVGAVELTIRCWMWREQRRLGPANERSGKGLLGMPTVRTAARTGAALTLRSDDLKSWCVGFCAQPAASNEHRIAQTVSGGADDFAVSARSCASSGSQTSVPVDGPAIAMLVIPV